MQELEKILEEIDQNQVMLKPFDEEDRPTGIINVDVVKGIIRKHMNDDWIPVEERLPEEKGVYLVAYHPCYWDNVGFEIRVGIDTFRGKTAWAKRKYQRVIAWRPLPDPYCPERRKR